MYEPKKAAATTFTSHELSGRQLKSDIYDTPV